MPCPTPQAYLAPHFRPGPCQTPPQGLQSVPALAKLATLQMVQELTAPSSVTLQLRQVCKLSNDCEAKYKKHCVFDLGKLHNCMELLKLPQTACLIEQTALTFTLSCLLEIAAYAVMSDAICKKVYSSHHRCFMTTGGGAALAMTPLGTIRESTSSWGSAEGLLSPRQKREAAKEADQAADNDADRESDFSSMLHENSQEAALSNVLTMPDVAQPREEQLPQAFAALLRTSEGHTGKAGTAEEGRTGDGLQSPSDTSSAVAHSVALDSELEQQASSSTQSVISEQMSEAELDAGFTLQEITAGELS